MKDHDDVDICSRCFFVYSVGSGQLSAIRCTHTYYSWTPRPKRQADIHTNGPTEPVPVFVRWQSDDNEKVYEPFNYCPNRQIYRVIFAPKTTHCCHSFIHTIFCARHSEFAHCASGAKVRCHPASNSLACNESCVRKSIYVHILFRFKYFSIIGILHFVRVQVLSSEDSRVPTAHTSVASFTMLSRRFIQRRTIELTCSYLWQTRHSHMHHSTESIIAFGWCLRVGELDDVSKSLALPTTQVLEYIINLSPSNDIWYSDSHSLHTYVGLFFYVSLSVSVVCALCKSCQKPKNVRHFIFLSVALFKCDLSFSCLVFWPNRHDRLPRSHQEHYMSLFIMWLI